MNQRCCLVHKRKALRMKCPSCGADVSTAFCEYCGSKMPLERIETQSIQAETVIVNNYYPEEKKQGPYFGSSQQPPLANTTYQGGQYAAIPQMIYASPKSKTIALLLCIFLGMFGAHRFYLGRYLLGVAFFFTLGFMGIGWIVDIVLLLLGKMKDRNGFPVLTG